MIHILNGIGPELKEIAAGIRARESQISFEELLDKMTEYEAFLQRQNSTEIAVHTAYVAQKFQPTRQVQRSYSSNRNTNGFNHHMQKRSNLSYRPVCQYCDKPGHIVKNCFQLRPKYQGQPSAHAAITSSKPQNN